MLSRAFCVHSSYCRDSLKRGYQQPEVLYYIRTLEESWEEYRKDSAQTSALYQYDNRHRKAVMKQA